jgi:hypothetical protein
MSKSLYIEVEAIDNDDLTDEEARELVRSVRRCITEDTDAIPEDVSVKHDDWAEVAQFVEDTDHRTIAELVGHAQAELQSGDLAAVEDTLTSLASRALRFVPDTEALDITPQPDGPEESAPNH